MSRRIDNLSTDFYRLNIEDHILITTLHEGVTDAISPSGGRLSDAPQTSVIHQRSCPAPESVNVSWKRKLGEYLVKDVVWEELRRRDIQWSQESVVQARLASLPEGYDLIRVPRKKDPQRFDHYLIHPLYDDKELRFRSPAEFAPHLAWLMVGQPRDVQGRPTCECCVCVKLKTGTRPKADESRYKDIHDLFSAPQRGAASSRRGQRGVRLNKPVPNRSSAQTVQDITTRAKDYRML